MDAEIQMISLLGGLTHVMFLAMRQQLPPQSLV